MSHTPQATDTATDGEPVVQEAPPEAPQPPEVGEAPEATETLKASDAAGASESGKAKAAAPPREVIAPEELALRVEAMLMATDRPLAPARVGELLGRSTVKAVTAAVESLNKLYTDSGRSFRIENVAGGWQILTLPRFADVLAALHKSREETRLGPAALETLAIIAYKQPVLRANVEAIRGVACGEVIRSLMERHLVKIVGRAEELGRPMLYGTTKSFLEVFGLASLKDLPRAEELRPKG